MGKYINPYWLVCITNNGKIKTYNIEKMWGLGTPEDLKYYLENN